MMKSKVVKPTMLKKGFSMIELIIVIAVLGVLTAVVLQQAQGMRESSNINKESSNLGMITSAVQATFTSQGDYTGLANDIVTRNNAFPANMVDDGAPANINSSWALAGVDITPTTFNGTADAAFMISYSSVPDSSCQDFVARNYPSFYRVDIGGTQIKHLEPGAAVVEATTPLIVTTCDGYDPTADTIDFYSR